MPAFLTRFTITPGINSVKRGVRFFAGLFAKLANSPVQAGRALPQPFPAAKVATQPPPPGGEKISLRGSSNRFAAHATPNPGKGQDNLRMAAKFFAFSKDLEWYTGLVGWGKPMDAEMALIDLFKQVAFRTGGLFFSPGSGRRKIPEADFLFANLAFQVTDL